MPGPRTLAGAVALGGRVYVAGGIHSQATADMSDILSYDPGTNTWRTAGTLSQRVYGAGTAALSGRVYVVGGSPGLSDLQIFDPATGRVELGPPMPFAMTWARATALGGRLHVIGVAEDPDNPLWCSCRIQHLRFDPSTGEWSSRAAPPSSGFLHDVVRYPQGAATINGRIYLVSGGENGDLAVYDPTTDSWTSAGGPRDRIGSAVVALGDRLYLLGGEDGFEEPIGTVDRYDPETGRWDRMPPLLTSRSSAAAAVVGQSIYVLGGYSGGPHGGSANERLTLE